MQRIVLSAILLSFFLCYINYGKAGTQFVGEAEYYLFIDIAETFTSIISALILIMFVTGQVMLLSEILFKPNGVRAITGISLLGFFVVIILIAGLLSGSLAGILSTLPFIILSIIYLLKFRKIRIGDDELLY